MDSRVRKALKFIEENLEKNLSLKILMRHCCLGHSRFCELFKREIGMTFKAYLKRRRIEKAKKLLKDDSLSIKEVSYEVGYKSKSTFCNDFKRFIGLTPSEYRAKYQIGNFNNKIGKFNNKKFLTL
ncbi:AraC family transcriptional regulator [Candidatus Aminicenantes bacterium AC-335-B20]|jgi:two-component system response regulator YesN|nr:AraC family transcriptional regulator [SCandidatus Aminicenantes bacterium Aminicenantia_JdfR_composite]MCP2598549.1 AraC family transcriptional regulator [Candidatus Aminicenantes bacterium AC-335-L06]MCP2598862.1 AraC family transcriptional regulator [Candidatus Aminicenantes bacterium AC-335-B20]